MTKKAKGITCGIIGIAIIAAIVPSSDKNKKVESIELSIPDYQIEYDINTKIPVDIVISPTNAESESIQFISSSESMGLYLDGIFTGDMEGSFDVYVVVDDVTSNTISINVVDFTGREYAMAESEAQQNDGDQLQDQTSTEDQSADAEQVTPDPGVPENEESASENSTTVPQTSFEQPAETSETNQQDLSTQPSVEEQPNVSPNEQQTSDTPPVQETEPQATVETPIPDAPVVQQSSEVNPPAEESSNGSVTDSSGNGSNFNTYDNASQQQTEDTYVLNTSSLKIHYPNGCSGVRKIAPQNYATSSATLDELLAQGYTTCGNCFQ